MTNKNEILFCILLILVYSIAGDSSSNNWGGFYFCSNYSLMFFLFKSYKIRIIRISGMTLSVSLFLYAFIKYFTNFECERYYTAIPFTIIMSTLILIEKWKK